MYFDFNRLAILFRVYSHGRKGLLAQKARKRFTRDEIGIAILTALAKDGYIVAEEEGSALPMEGFGKAIAVHVLSVYSTNRY